MPIWTSHLHVQLSLAKAMTFYPENMIKHDLVLNNRPLKIVVIVAPNRSLFGILVGTSLTTVLESPGTPSILTGIIGNIDHTCKGGLKKFLFGLPTYMYRFGYKAMDFIHSINRIPLTIM